MPSYADTTEYISFQNSLSAFMLAFVIALAVLITDASIVVGLVGSLCGAATIYVIPCFLFDRCTIKGDHLCTFTERIVVRTIGICGVFLMIAGAIVTVVPM